ncbi:MAG: H-type lectin domain-containing protein [Shimia sp.]
MRRLRNHQIGVDQGDLQLFSDFEKGGAMWTGEGDREVRTRAFFAEPFRAPPVVHVSFSMLDLDGKTNPRLHLRAEAIDEEGFLIVLGTWGDSRIARIRVAWTAIGELRFADDWDLY